MVHRVLVPFGYEPFREVARRLVQADLPPSEVHLLPAADDDDLLAGGDDGLPEPPEVELPITVPLAFVRRLSRMLCHRDRERLNLAYRLLWRVVHGERRLLSDPAHPDVQWFLRLEQAVTQDVHHFVAVARFRPVPGPPRPGLLAYHRPRWRTARLAAPRFVTRFRGRAFALLTPDESALWDGAELSFGPGFGALPDLHELGPRWQAFYGQHADAFRLGRRGRFTLRTSMSSGMTSRDRRLVVSPMNVSRGHFLEPLPSRTPGITSASKPRGART